MADIANAILNNTNDYFSDALVRDRQTRRQGQVMGIQDQLAAAADSPWMKYNIYAPGQARQTYLADDEQLKLGAKLARGVLGMAPDKRAEGYEQILRVGGKLGIDTSDMPREYDEAFLNTLAGLGIDLETQMRLEAEEKARQGNRDWEIQKLGIVNRLADERADRELSRDMQLADYKARIKASEAKPFDTKGTADLRKEFRTNNKDYYTMGDAFAKINKNYQNPSAAGDLSLIFNYMKMLDPQSVVRESEFANAEKARAWFDSAGVPTSVRLAYGKAKEGTKLTADQRKDFYDKAGELYQAQRERFGNEAAYYSDIARASNIDPRYVVSDPYNFESKGREDGDVIDYKDL